MLKDVFTAIHVPYAYGFAIILLTVIVKVLTFPLTKQQVNNCTPAVQKEKGFLVIIGLFVPAVLCLCVYHLITKTSAIFSLTTDLCLFCHTSASLEHLISRYLAR